MGELQKVDGNAPSAEMADGANANGAKNHDVLNGIAAALALGTAASAIVAPHFMALEVAVQALSVGGLATAAASSLAFYKQRKSAVGGNATDECAAEGPQKSAGKPVEEPACAAQSQSSAKVVTLTYTDKATGLGNKARFIEKFNNMAKAHTLATPQNAKPFAVGLMNLDGMKPINDLFGIEGGDALIAQCASRLRTALEGRGFVYRYEGDEFAFVLPEITSEDALQRFGRLIQDVMAAPFDINGSVARLSGSFGFAIYPDAGTTIEKLTTAFETALYNSKRMGRSRVTVYTSEVEKAIRENAILEQALRRAISDRVISPHFQPIISLQDGRLLGFEALARWVDPDHGFVSPGRFVPLAEERGLIAPLTEVLLVEAAKAAADWPEDLFLSFNLSSAQLVDPRTATVILDTISRAGLPPHRLEIEVTETAMMSDPHTATQIIADLHNAGVRISMDDFGTGQSSLGRLRELKLDKVKIDRAFIAALAEDKPAQHIVRAILEMCAGLELTVVAEGIEEIEQAESLKQFGCHAGQGYLFGKPQDAIRTMGYIREFRRVAKSDREAKVA